MIKKELKVSAIREGTVIDHIPAECTLKVVQILNLNEHKDVISIASNLASKRIGKKGIIKIGGKHLTKKEVDKISIVAPKATLNSIENYEVKQKLKLSLPDEFTGIIKCDNPQCITNNEGVKTLFHVIEKYPIKARCHYCERVIEGKDIELL